MRRTSPLGHAFASPEGVYTPAEDSWLLAEALAGEGPWDGARAADVGCGAGVQAVTLAEAGARVVATDRLREAAACTRANARENGLGDRVDVVRTDLVSALAGGRLDVVACNPPYLPRSGVLEGAEVAALESGASGLEATLTLVDDLDRVLAPDGAAYVVASTRADLDLLDRRVDEAGFASRTVDEASFPFETLEVRALRRQAD